MPATERSDLFSASDEPASAAQRALELSENEQKVDHVPSNEEPSIDEVISHSELPSSAISGALLSQEMN